MTKINKLITASVSVCILAIGGCSSGGSDTDQGQPGPDILRQSNVSHDYDIKSSVEEVRTATDHSVVGTVAKWHAGPIIEESGMQDSYAVLEVRPLKTGSASPPTDPVFVRVHLGGVPVDGNGKVIELTDPDVKYTALSLDDVVEAIPTGTRVIALGFDVVVEDPDNPEYNPTVVKDWKTPDGSALIDSHPQGLLFETSDGRFESAIAHEGDFTASGWGKSFDDLVKQLEG